MRVQGERDKMDYKEIFNKLNPGFFDREYLKNMKEDWIFAELVMDLKKEYPMQEPVPCPESIAFRYFEGNIDVLRKAVSEVNRDWVQYFNEGGRYFCAYARDEIAAFCFLGEMGRVEDLRVGGPGCVGTVPKFRKQGIGLRMVQIGTEILKRDGFDLSWIHFTHLEKWYMKLGYEPVLHWNCKGFI